jgi:hypothetical protein
MAQQMLNLCQNRFRAPFAFTPRRNWTLDEAGEEFRFRSTVAVRIGNNNSLKIIERGGWTSAYADAKIWGLDKVSPPRIHAFFWTEARKSSRTVANTTDLRLDLEELIYQETFDTVKDLFNDHSLANHRDALISAHRQYRHFYTLDDVACVLEQNGTAIAERIKEKLSQSLAYYESDAKAKHILKNENLPYLVEQLSYTNTCSAIWLQLQHIVIDADTITPQQVGSAAAAALPPYAPEVDNISDQE